MSECYRRCFAGCGLTVKKKNTPEASCPLFVLLQIHHAANKPIAAKAPDISPEKQRDTLNIARGSGAEREKEIRGAELLSTNRGNCVSDCYRHAAQCAPS